MHGVPRLEEMLALGSGEEVGYVDHDWIAREQMDGVGWVCALRILGKACLDVEVECGHCLCRQAGDKITTPEYLHLGAQHQRRQIILPLFEQSMEF